MSEKHIRHIVYYRDYYLNFFAGLRPPVKSKFNWTLQLIATLDRIPERYFKHLSGTNGLYEIRVEVGSDIYRVFCFFDKQQLVILMNGFVKKSHKTPRSMIQQAEKLLKQYFNEKEK